MAENHNPSFEHSQSVRQDELTELPSNNPSPENPRLIDLLNPPYFNPLLRPVTFEQSIRGRPTVRDLVGREEYDAQEERENVYRQQARKALRHRRKAGRTVLKRSKDS